MRFLIDENLSPKLVAVLQSAYSGTTHVAALGLRGLVDSDVWTAARDGGFAILTKKPIVPRAEEVRRNRRARSAKLRALERVS